MAIKKGLKTTKGLSLKDILSMDVYKLNTKSLKMVLNKLVSAANKRLSRIEKNNKISQSPSYRALQQKKADEWIDGKGNGKVRFSSRGVNDHNEIEKSIKEVKGFLKAESSTMKGIQAQRKKIERDIGTFKDEEQEKEFWNIYNDWIKKHKNLNARFNDSFQIRDMLKDLYVTQGKSERGAKMGLTKSINKMLNDIAIQESNDNLMMEDELLNGKVQFDNREDF